MANVFTNTNTDALSTIVLDELMKSLAPVTAFTLDASPQAFYRGDRVKVLSVDTASAATTFTTAYEMQDVGAKTKDIPLTHSYTSAQLSDADWRNSGLLTIDAFARSKAHALGKKILDDTFTYFSASATTCPTSMSVSTTSMRLNAVMSASNLLDNNNAEPGGRVLILAPSYHQALRTDTAVQNAASFGGSEAVRRGEIPNIDTFERVVKCNNMPNGVAGFAVAPSAGVIAMRAVETQDREMYQLVQSYTDEATGVTITSKRWGDHDAGAVRQVWETNFGVASGNKNAIVMLYEE